MLALTITDIKDFMNKLLIGDVFDRFCLTEASITTFNTFTIDGHLQMDFFDTDTVDSLKEKSLTHSCWKDLKPFCYSLIRGKRTPVSFKIIFHLSRHQIQNLFDSSGCGISPEDIGGAFLNLQYKNKSLLCTTGLSLRSFTADRRPQQLWDNTVLDFFNKHGILFEEG